MEIQISMTPESVDIFFQVCVSTVLHRKFPEDLQTQRIGYSFLCSIISSAQGPGNLSGDSKMGG